MPTDDERRDVARRLRELPGDSTYPDLIGVIADRDGWYPASDAADRLADLIDPGEPKVRCVAEVKVDGEQLEKLVHDAVVELTGIDRDALLTVAEGLDNKADDIMRAAQHAGFSKLGPTMDKAKFEASEWRGVANRIREALEVCDCE